MKYKVSPQILTRLVPRDEVESMVPALRKLEKVFPPELEMSTKEVRESVTRDGAVVFVAEHDGRVVGASYCNTMKSIDSDFFDGYWDPLEWNPFNGSHNGMVCRGNSLYVTSTAVAPTFRKLGVATALKLQTIDYLRKVGHGDVVGHSNSGPMTKTYLALGGERVKLFRHWYGSNENHWLCQIWSGRFDALWPVPPVKQANDWDCGVACAAQLAWHERGWHAGEFDYRDAYRELEPSREDGVSPERIVDKFIDFGVPSALYRDNRTSELRDCLRDSLVMVNFQSRWGGHYVNMIGFSGDTLYYWDVADARVKHISTADFERRWYSRRYGKRIMIVPERS